jgi:hypothetical protein
MSRFGRIFIAIALAASLGAAASDLGQKLQFQLSEANNALGKMEKELQTLETIISAEKKSPASKPATRRRPQCTNNLKQFGLATHNHANRLENLLAKQKGGSTAAEAASALAKTSLEFSRMAGAFPKAAGPGDDEALARLSKLARKARGQMEYLQVELKNVMITSYQTGGS